MGNQGSGVSHGDWDELEQTLRGLLVDVLGLDAKRVASFDAATELFGALPEFDSMAVATLLTGLEERLAMLIEDDDVEAEDFATFGTLMAFVRRKALI
jgi:acyl carrier protein